MEYGQFDPPPIFALKMFYFNLILNFLSKYNDFNAKFVTIVIFMYELDFFPDILNYRYTNKKPIKKIKKKLKITFDDIKRHKYTFHVSL